MSQFQHEVATIQASFALTTDITLLRVSSPAIVQRAQPGQFVMARVLPAWDPFLRTPLLIAGIDAEDAALTLWVPAGSAARERLQQVRMGSQLDLLGPLGRSFIRRDGLRQVLLVVEGNGVGPLLSLAHEFLTAGIETALLAVIPADSDPYPPEALPVALEYQRAPRGEAGAVAHEMIRWAGTIYASGSRQFYHDLAAAIRDARPGQRGGFAFGISVEPFGWEPPAWQPARLACGLGACGSCLVPMGNSSRLACLDGPTFDLWAL